MEADLPPIPPPPVTTDAESIPRQKHRKGSAASSSETSAAPTKKKRWLCQYGQPAKAWDSSWDSTWQSDWKSSQRCYFEASGMCRYGNTCKFQHAGKKLNQWNGLPSDSWVWSNSEQQSDEAKRDFGDSWDDEEARSSNQLICPLFQLGCCYFDDRCWYLHTKMLEEDGLKTRLCAQFLKTGECSKERECPDAHGKEQLQTPRAFVGMPGYKGCLCTFYAISGKCDDGWKCFNAHGPLELRRSTLTMPHSLTEVPFQYSDAHVHLDHVLLSRKYGSTWFYKHETCKKPKCSYGKQCLWVHEEAERQQRPLDVDDLVDFMTELESAPGHFAGCVHSCCEVHRIAEAVQLVSWGRERANSRVFVSFGIHPNDFEELSPDVEAKMITALELCGKQAVAWGECGLDYYRRKDDMDEDPSLRDQMMDAFARQARIAVSRELPLVVHSRCADEDTMKVLSQEVPQQHPVYLHSFMGSLECIDEFLCRWPNGQIGVVGAVSYEGAEQPGGIVDIVRQVPLERMLLETDGPYMAPNPYRGEESHPGHIPWIAEAIARVKQVSTAEVLKITHQNFCRMYRITAHGPALSS